MQPGRSAREARRTSRPFFSCRRESASRTVASAGVVRVAAIDGRAGLQGREGRDVVGFRLRHAVRDHVLDDAGRDADEVGAAAEMAGVVVAAEPADHRDRHRRHQAGGAAHPAVDELRLEAVDEGGEPAAAQRTEPGIEHVGGERDTRCGEPVMMDRGARDHGDLLHARHVQAGHHVGGVGLRASVGAARHDVQDAHAVPSFAPSLRVRTRVQRRARSIRLSADRLPSPSWGGVGGGGNPRGHRSPFHSGFSTAPSAASTSSITPSSDSLTSLLRNRRTLKLRQTRSASLAASITRAS